ncbi:YkgJ family cysteine cluster protein [Halonotius aquaticus]|uniref:YkgJ family cysteine cluster protein n=1 Tax=Halonotius aquaticus TaxID=2216978 RepID=A0A3A6PTN1_9EURY|nr:YkgJ family cysteine cluster protein [Halonotius aquaticus]RJX43895.1 YkgJ family cysteine cluster protein [Halonotius aquaticus]
MDSLETELDRACSLAVDDLADAIESIGFECTRCGACCKGYDPDSDGDEEKKEADATDREPHTATVFPDEIRELQDAGDYDWRDVARPMPYGLDEEDGAEATAGETFEWALQTDACGDCTFYEERDDGTGHCGVHDDRPLICKTYPFSVALGGTSQPMGEAVDGEGMVRAHECEGLGRDISRSEAKELAAALKERAIREIEEAIAVRENYESRDVDGVVVHDSEGQKRPDGTKIGSDRETY